MAPPERSNKNNIYSSQRPNLNIMNKNPNIQSNNNNNMNVHGDEYEDDNSNKAICIVSTSSQQVDNSQNIDHILDNMFVQRPPHFPPTTGLVAATRKSSSPAPVDAAQKLHLQTDVNAPVDSPSNDTYTEQTVESTLNTGLESADLDSNRSNNSVDTNTTTTNSLATEIEVSIFSEH